LVPRQKGLTELQKGLQKRMDVDRMVAALCQALLVSFEGDIDAGLDVLARTSAELVIHGRDFRHSDRSDEDIIEQLMSLVTEYVILYDASRATMQ